MNEDVEDVFELLDQDEPMDPLIPVFARAKCLAEREIGKPGKTSTPWLFGKFRLTSKLKEEYNEWLDAATVMENYSVEREKKELLDVINLAAFLYLNLDGYSNKNMEKGAGADG